MSNPTLADLGYAQLDLERQRRCGFPEVVFAEGKSLDNLAGILGKLREAGQDALATRVSEEQAAHLAKLFPGGMQNRLARTFWYPQTAMALVGDVVVVTAGTTDLPVAAEACVTLEAMGIRATLIADVGVAGLHRILRQRERLASADVLIVVAGMDGALPSVVGGLVDVPVIAVPTSVGYGAAFGGLAPLLAMLNSCAAGVVTVNIDAGFKAGYTAALIARRLHAKATSPAATAG